MQNLFTLCGSTYVFILLCREQPVTLNISLKIFFIYSISAHIFESFANGNCYITDEIFFINPTVSAITRKHDCTISEAKPSQASELRMEKEWVFLLTGVYGFMSAIYHLWAIGLEAKLHFILWHRFSYYWTAAFSPREIGTLYVKFYI